MSCLYCRQIDDPVQYFHRIPGCNFVRGSVCCPRSRTTGNLLTEGRTVFCWSGRPQVLQAWVFNLIGSNQPPISILCDSQCDFRKRCANGGHCYCNFCGYYTFCYLSATWLVPGPLILFLLLCAAVLLQAVVQARWLLPVACGEQDSVDCLRNARCYASCCCTVHNGNNSRSARAQSRGFYHCRGGAFSHPKRLLMLTCKILANEPLRKAKK